MPIEGPKLVAAPSGMAIGRGTMSGRVIVLQVLVLLGALQALNAASFEASDLPRRKQGEVSGSPVAEKVRTLERKAREEMLVTEILDGNVPDSWRRFVEVTVTRTNAGSVHRLAMSVALDYLTVGTDADSWLTPLSPQAAERIADRLGCMLPTRRMVDDIYAAAAIKLEPQPMTPGPEMTTVSAFLAHDGLVRTQRLALAGGPRPAALVAGHKKDVVLTPRLATSQGKVAIYGWHRTNGQAIQPLDLGHTDAWVDYSHGIRLVRRAMTLDGAATTADAILADPAKAFLLSDEGVIASARYGSSVSSAATPGHGTGPTSSAAVGRVPPLGVVSTNGYGERNDVFTINPGVRVWINQPAEPDPVKPVRLVLYALPNGNTIEWTIGKKPGAGDDWRFDIQHIGAQTRWLRAADTNVTWAVAYLEATNRAWPTWRRLSDPKDTRIREIVDEVKGRFAGKKLSVVLTGHSGGGSFTFGYLNGVDTIPADVERIAFLDSNYAYDSTKGHADKLATWLAGGTNRVLTVLAHHDSIALLNGKTFVSEAGGTWGRSHAMAKDLGDRLSMTKAEDADWENFSGLAGRIRFLLRKNPKKEILHTRQVEWNGFIHSMALNTQFEDVGYGYFGERAYGKWISE